MVELFRHIIAMQFPGRLEFVVICIIALFVFANQLLKTILKLNRHVNKSNGQANDESKKNLLRAPFRHITKQYFDVATKQRYSRYVSSRIVNQTNSKKHSKVLQCLA